MLKKLLRKNRFTASLLELHFLKKNYLSQTGWLESRFRLESLNAKGEAIPWLTYPAIYFLENRLNNELSLFEYGSGHSTIWFSKRVGQVISVEHDKNYYEKMVRKLSKLSNVNYHQADLDRDYVSKILEFDQEFDLLIIDGRKRVECCEAGLQRLSSRGVIIWDNSDRQRYQKGMRGLLERGFRRIDFVGHAPISHNESCTSIFYRNDNCLDI